MGVQGKPETADASVVSASTVGGGDPSLLSLRTDKSSYSIPDDGRAIMIETNRRHKSGNIESSSAVSAASQTSLLIEYFEGARGSGSSPSHRPSVRVKVTPSAQRKLNQQGTREIELRGTDGSRQGSKRIPSYTQRISLSPRSGADDRLTVGGKHKSRRHARSRSTSGDHQSGSGHTFDEDGRSISSISEQSQIAPLNVEVIREGFSPRDSPRYRRDGSGKDDEPSGKLHRRRSRSLSNERETVLGEGSKPSTRRTRSSERERTKEQRRAERHLAVESGSRKSSRRSRSTERRTKDKKSGKKSRSVSRERSGSHSRNVSNSSELAQNPVLLEAVEDAIKRLILPQLEALKVGQHSGVDAEAIAAEAARNYRNRQSTTDVTLGTDGPLLVLQPDTDQGTGHGLVLAGEQDDMVHRSESVRSRGPGFGTGPDPGSHLAEGARLPTPPEDFVPMEQAGPAERIRMPSIPTIPSSVHSRDADLYGDHKNHSGYGMPYPATASESGMPASGRTPPFQSTSSAQPVDPLNISNDDSVAQRAKIASPTSSVASLRRNFEEAAANMAKTLRESERLKNASGFNIGAGAGAASQRSKPCISGYEYDTQLDQEGSEAGLSYTGGISHDQYGSYNAPPRDRPVEWWVNKEHHPQDPPESDHFEEGGFDPKRYHLNRGSTADSFEAKHLEKVAAGQGVRDVGALASMRSTPVGLASMQASVHEQMSNASFNSQPQLTHNAIPIFGHDLPAIDHIQSDIGDEDDVVTNPYGDKSNSRELAMQGGQWTYADDHDHDHDQDQYTPADLGNLGANFGLRALQRGAFNPDLASRGSSRTGLDRDSAASPQGRDEGYMSAANPMSPGNRTPEDLTRELEAYGAIDDIMSEDNPDFIPFRGHARGGSGNSHGMPSPLYDSAMGRGLDRIQSKDIVALMDHLTVRDAQRNARDTEILITLVRSAAEMRDSFEDLRKLVHEHTRQVITDVEHNTERSMAKLQGPRPLPAPVPRAIRSRAFDEEKEETTKKTNVFRRALRGLSMKSSHDLARIEEMLVTLLDEVEGLKSTSYAYSVSNTASHTGEQSQSQSRQSHSRQSHHTANVPAQSQSALGYNYDLNPVPEEAGISQPIVARDSAYLEDGDNNININNSTNNRSSNNTPNASKTSLVRDYNTGSPVVIDESGMRTPRGLRDVQNAPSGTPPQNVGFQASQESTPGKSKDKRESSSSAFPKISRWSETTASSGIRSFFGRKKKGEAIPSGTNSEFEEDWLQGSSADPNSPYMPPGQSPLGREGVVEKPSLEANRRSLDIKHPQPRFTYHHSLEQAAEGGVVNPPSPAYSASTTSLNRFIQTGTTYHNVSSLSPMVPDNRYEEADDIAEDDYTPSRTPRINIDSPIVPGDVAPEDASDSQPTPEKKRKHKHKHRERGERSERHSRHRSSRHKSRDQLSIPHESEEDGLATRSISSASRKPAGPRPPSVASNRSYRQGDDPGTPSRRQRASHLTTDTFGI